MSPKSGGNGSHRKIGWRHFVYGGVASIVAEGSTFPLDTTKTRLQVQGQQAKHLVSSGVSPIRTTYLGMLDALIRIPKEEGIRALYRGISPAILRQSIYGTLKFGVYYSLKRLFPEENVMSNVICAIIAGMTSSALANPTDVLKVRMQVASAVSPSLVTAFVKIYTLEGVGGLWRGVGPTSQRAAIIAALELPVYDGCKKYFIEHEIMTDSPPNHIISSFIASLAAVCASTPADVIRTRLMSQKIHRSSECNEIKPGKIYRGSWDCLTTTIRHEGFLSLYRGFLPAWLRMGPWNLIFFTSYEQLLRLY